MINKAFDPGYSMLPSTLVTRPSLTTSTSTREATLHGSNVMPPVSAAPR